MQDSLLTGPTALSDSSSLRQPELEPSEGLPEGWSSAVSESTGDAFYINNLTGETTWERPRGDTALSSSLQQPEPEPGPEPEPQESLPEGWSSAVSQSTGDAFYINDKTGETTWERPLADETAARP